MEDINIYDYRNTGHFGGTSPQKHYEAWEWINLNKNLGATGALSDNRVLLIQSNPSTASGVIPAKKPIIEKIETLYKEYQVALSCQSDPLLSRTYDKLYDIIKTEPNKLLDFISGELFEKESEDENWLEFLGELIALIAKLTNYTNEQERKNILKKALESDSYYLRYGVVMYLSKRDALSLVDDLRMAKKHETYPILKSVISKLLTRLNNGRS